MTHGKDITAEMKSMRHTKSYD